MSQLPLGLTAPSLYAPGDMVVPTERGETRGWDSTLAGCVVHVNPVDGRVWVRWSDVSGSRRYDMLPADIRSLGRQEGEWAWTTYPELILRRRLSAEETALLMDGNMPCRNALAWLAESGEPSLSDAWPLCPAPFWMLWWLKYKARPAAATLHGLSLDLAQACLDRLHDAHQWHEAQALLDEARVALAAGVTDWPDLRAQATETFGLPRDQADLARQLAIVMRNALADRDHWLVDAMSLALTLTNDMPLNNLRQMILRVVPSPLPEAGNTLEHPF